MIHGKKLEKEIEDTVKECQKASESLSPRSTFLVTARAFIRHLSPIKQERAYRQLEEVEKEYPAKGGSGSDPAVAAEAKPFHVVSVSMAKPSSFELTIPSLMKEAVNDKVYRDLKSFCRFAINYDTCPDSAAKEGLTYNIECDDEKKTITIINASTIPGQGLEKFYELVMGNERALSVYINFDKLKEIAIAWEGFKVAPK